MARTTLTDLAALPDPQFQWLFDLEIANVPGSGSGEALKVRCMSTALPGISIEPVTVQLHGKEINYAGREIFSKTLAVTFLETRDIVVRNTLLRWAETARKELDATGGFKSDYATDGNILLYDDKGAVVRTILLKGLWMQDFQEAQMDGATSAAVNLSATLSFDWFEDSGSTT